jgi:hypothetical protein
MVYDVGGAQSGVLAGMAELAEDVAVEGGGGRGGGFHGGGGEWGHHEQRRGRVRAEAWCSMVDVYVRAL